MSKDPLPRLLPWYIRAALGVLTWVTWPARVRELKRLGYQRVGWMTWEAGPENPLPTWLEDR